MRVRSSRLALGFLTPATAVVLGIAVAFTGAPQLAPPALAQTAPPSQSAEPVPRGIAISPLEGTPGRSASGSHFELGDVAIGRRVHGELLARNIGDTVETGDLYAADALPARGGGFGFSARTEKPKDVGAWITIDTRRITLRPHEETTFGFDLVIPAGATGGEHIGGIVLEPVAPASGGAGVKIGTRQAVGIYLTVTGATAAAPRPELTITRLTAPLRDGAACPTVSYTNSGTTVLDPTVDIEVDPVLGRRPTTYPAGKAGGVAPGESLTVDLPCVRKVPVGKSTLTIRLKYPQGSAQKSVDVNRWPFTVLAAGSLLLLLLLALLWLFFLAKRRNRDENDEPAVAVPAQVG